MKKIVTIIIILASFLIMPKEVYAEFYAELASPSQMDDQFTQDCRTTAYACVVCQYKYYQKDKKGELKEVYKNRVNVFSDNTGDIYLYEKDPIKVTLKNIGSEVPVLDYLHGEETFYTADKKKLQCPENLYLYQDEEDGYAFFSQYDPDNEPIMETAREQGVTLTVFEGKRSEIRQEINPCNDNYILSSYKDEAKTFDCPVPTYSTLSTDCTYGDVIVTFDYSGIMGTKATHTEYGLTFQKDSGARDVIDEIKTDLSNNTCPTDLYYSCGFGDAACSLKKGAYPADISTLPMCDDFAGENAGKITCRIDSITVDKSSTLEHAIVDIDIPTKTITGYEWANANYSDYTIVDTDVSNFVTDYAYFEDAITQGCPTDVRLVCDPSTKTCHLTTEFQYRASVTNLYPIGSELEIFISSITGLCVDYLGHASVKGTLANTIDKIFTIIKVAAIVLFVGFTMKEFLGVITSAKSELQPVLMTSVKRAVILILILLIPTIIDMVFGLFGFTDVLCGIK